MREFFRKLWRRLWNRRPPAEEGRIVTLGGHASMRHKVSMSEVKKGVSEELRRARLKKRQKMVTELAKRMMNG